MQRETAARSGHRQWILLLFLFLASLPAVTPRIYSSDEIQYFAYLRSLWFDHDLSFENEYQYFYDRDIARSEGFHTTFLELETAAGRRINFATIGCAILWAPFYAVGDAAARTLHAAGRPVAIDGFSKPYVAAVAYGSSVYGAAAVALAILSAALLGYRSVAPGLIVWLGTPLLFYMYVAPPMSHACSAFAVALFVYTWLRVRATWSPKGMMALGATGALMAMVREQDLFFVAGPALDFLWSTLPSARPAQRRGLAASALAGAATFALAFLPQVLTYERLNGHLGPHESVARKMTWTAPHALQVLFSSEHGYFLWTPLALIALVGLALMVVAPERRLSAEGESPETGRLPFSRTRRVGVCLLLMVALQIYVGGSVESWTVAGGYGQRRFVALTALLVIGYAALRDRAPSREARIALACVTVLAVYWNIALGAEFAVGLMDHQRLEPRRNAYDAFVTIPLEGPSIAYRYLFDRASFYRPAPGGGAR